MEQVASNKFEQYGAIAMVVATLLAVAASFAAPRFAHAECGGGRQAEHEVFMGKRQAELHDKLGLSAAQQGAWNDFVAKIKPEGQQTRPYRAEMAKLATPERLDRMLARMKERQQRMEAHAQAIKDFYAQLTPEQKKVFDASFLPGPGRHGGR